MNVSVSDLKAATITKVSDGAYRIEGADWSVDLGATSKADALAKAIEWKLGELRTVKVDEIRAALAASDVWAVRHVEDGASLTEARRQYRATLRALIAEAASSDDPVALTVPPVPAFP